jgi:hypothetical protein
MMKTSLAACSIVVACSCGVQAQAGPVRELVEALGLPCFSRGRVTVHYSVGERERAEHFVRLSENVAAHYEQELGVAFPFDVVVLAPDDWLQRQGPGMPYGIPWAPVAERMIFVPSSLREGALIESDAVENRHMVDAVLVHEFGHLVNKAYFHPDSAHEEFPILWFEELVANFVSYRYAALTDSAWAQSVRQRSRRGVERFTPSTRSLDWSFMRELSGPEAADTYGWYQYMLNLRAADLYAEYGQMLLPRLRAELSIDALDRWTTKSLLDELDRIAPGFHAWVGDLERGSLP